MLPQKRVGSANFQKLFAKLVEDLKIGTADDEVNRCCRRRHHINAHLLDLNPADAGNCAHGFFVDGINDLPDISLAPLLLNKSEHEGNTVDLGHLVASEVR